MVKPVVFPRMLLDEHVSLSACALEGFVLLSSSLRFFLMQGLLVFVRSQVGQSILFGMAGDFMPVTCFTVSIVFFVEACPNLA